MNLFLFPSKITHLVAIKSYFPAKILFGAYQRSLYSIQKAQSPGPAQQHEKATNSIGNNEKPLGPAGQNNEASVSTSSRIIAFTSLGSSNKLVQLALEIIPGTDLKRKGAFVALTSGLTAALIQTDIYIVNNESPLLLTFILLLRVLYLKAGPIIKEFIENEENKTVKELQEAFFRRKNALISRLEYLNTFKETRSLFEEYLSVKKENVHLEVELESLLQETKHLQDIKFKLDDMVRKITEQKASQKRSLIESTRSRILEQLKSTEKQNSILTECLGKLDSIHFATNAIKS